MEQAKDGKETKMGHGKRAIGRLCVLLGAAFCSFYCIREVFAWKCIGSYGALELRIFLGFEMGF